MNYKKINLKERKKLKCSTKDSILDELLALRNIDTEEKIEKFLNPKREDFIDIYAFSDMKKAKDRILKAIKDNQKILVWGDFDCDGVTSSSILYKTLDKLGADFEVFIPDRLLHGHGLNSKELLRFASKDKIKLVITVDCGISNIKEVALLKGLGVDTIITDHHTTDIELPNAYAIINPQVKGALDDTLSVDDIEALTYNSGSVVAYKLAMALLEDIKDEDLKDELLTVASCGAIADVVPLRYENRAIVKYGLELLNKKKEKSNLGIYRLLSQNIKDREFNSTDIAFILAPRVNAVGRLNSAKISFDFITSNNLSEIDLLIEKLNNFNSIRQSMCTSITDDVMNYLKNNPDEKENPAIILFNPDWHVGIIGIVAARIVEEYNKPCFLMTKDEENNARCSIRSNDLINVYQVLKENEELFLGFGGHKLAGGCSFNLSEHSFDEVKASILNTITEQIGDKKIDDTLYCDLELKGDDIELNLLDTIDKLEPFGQDNEAPLCASFNVILDDFKTIGKENNHLKFDFSIDDKKFQGVRWQENELLIPKGVRCDIAYYPRLNIFNDIKSIQLELVDIYYPELKKQENNSLKIFDHRKKTGILEQIALYFERDNLDIGVWAKTLKTKEVLSKYQKIKDNFIEKIASHNGLMLFDYPSNIEEFKSILSSVKPKKLHLMNQILDENIENYIKQINGMLKYCANHLDGKIEIPRIAQALGVSENFIQIALEILDSIASINILDIDKIEYLKPINYSEFSNNSMFEVLKDEFENILEFKKSLLNCDIKEFEELIEI